MAKKTKKSKDLTKCCAKCNFFNSEKEICSIDANDTTEDSVCKRFESDVIRRCQRCGKELKYRDKTEYYNTITLFEAKSQCGDSTGQNFHLCHACKSVAFIMFGDLLENILQNRKEDNDLLNLD